jgi:DNA mismatch repair ATPase MutL
MNRTQRILLSFVCALALVLIPMAYSWAQDSAQQPATSSQQDQVDRNGVNQNQDTNRDSNVTSDQNNLNREKPSSTVTEPSPTQSQDQNQNINQSNQDQNKYNSQSTTSSSTTQKSETSTSSQKTTDQNADNKEGLPRTAGELPLIALLGLLSLAAATGTRVLSRVRSR